MSSRRILVIRSVGDAGGMLRLPYLIKNDSNLLLAFRQVGCGHWDLLGAGEAGEFAWDAPLSTRMLELHVRDTSCAWAGGASWYSLEQLERSQELRLDRTGFGKVIAQTALHGPERGVAEDPLVVSVACELRYGDEADASADGWLCATHKCLTFIFHANGAAARHLANQKALQTQRSGSAMRTPQSRVRAPRFGLHAPRFGLHASARLRMPPGRL